MILRPLTAELDSKDSPVRRFLDDRFTSGLRDVQRRYRQAGPSLVVSSADRQEANPGTVGTAADWLLRFMLHPRPSLALAATGAALCGRRSGVVDAFTEIAESLGYDSDAMLVAGATDFIGPVGGHDADPGQLASACWALALLTEMFRNPMVAMRGPLERFQGHRASAGELLGLASPAAVGQLVAFREVFASTLLPQLARWPGRWVLGPGFTGSALIKADGDLIAAGLLLDLKTDSKLSLGVTTMFQVIGYALLDFDDAYQLTEAGTFSARYAYLATWDIGMLFDELAGHHVSLPFIRQEFRELLLAHHLSANESLLEILQSGFVTGQVQLRCVLGHTLAPGQQADRIRADLDLFFAGYLSHNVTSPSAQLLCRPSSACSVAHGGNGVVSPGMGAISGEPLSAGIGPYEPAAPFAGGQAQACPPQPPGDEAETPAAPWTAGTAVAW